MGKLDAKEVEFERKLQTQKESLYIIVSVIYLTKSTFFYSTGNFDFNECSSRFVLFLVLGLVM